MGPIRKYGIPPFQVALIHGGPGAAGEMAPVARELSTFCGVLEPLQGSASVGGQISELNDQLEPVATLPVTLVGFSWGALLGILFTAAYPGTVRKLILVGCPPLEQKYADGIRETRMSRLTEGERARVESLFEILEDPADGRRQEAFVRLGEIFSHADACDPIESASGPVDTDVGIFQRVWPEALELRTSGQLIRRAGTLACPVIAIHGDTDPHPADGVKLPLGRSLRDFRFIELKNCGHRPWIERKAKDEFFTLLRQELTSNT